MIGIGKAALAITGAGAAVMIAPVLILTGVLPSQTSQGLFAACSQLRGARASIVPDPPPSVLQPDEVLLRIARTATTLGFGRQGEVVAAAISLRATGLTNAANPAVPDTERYAHSVKIDAGAGALALPLSWGTAPELMTPEVSTALVMDQMVERIPAWRDTEPAEIAAQLLGGTAADYASAVAAASARLDRLPPPANPAGQPDRGFTPSPPAASVLGAPADHAATTPVPPPPPLSSDEARTAAANNPEVSSCLEALTTIVPPPAPGPNPRGAALADAAQRAVGTELEHPDSAAFVSQLCLKHAVQIPDSITAQMTTGWSVDDPSPGDLAFVDISASHGPHLVGLVVADDTMVTVLPGHTAPEWARIGPNRILRRIEVNAL